MTTFQVYMISQTLFIVTLNINNKTMLTLLEEKKGFSGCFSLPTLHLSYKRGSLAKLHFFFFFIFLPPRQKEGLLLKSGNYHLEVITLSRPVVQQVKCTVQ